ncbi:MAG: DUF3617 family protein [Pseudomonadota bacterium]|nr:DUF3617 family protein [Pseudomonadota bacterium]
MNIRTLINALLACSPTGVSYAEAMSPGKWEYTMTSSVSGVPFAQPALTTHLCLTRADVTYGLSVSRNSLNNGNCRYQRLRHSGDTTRYDMVCPGSASVQGRFEFTSTPATVRGKGMIDTGTTQITQQWSGRRLGGC